MANARAAYNPAMAKWTTHRDAVKEALKQQKKSVYSLHKQLSHVMSASLLYDYLNKKTGLSLENAEAINKVLGIRYTDEK